MMNTKWRNRISKLNTVVKTYLFENRPRVAYVGGWLGKQNLGDELLFEAIQSIFSDFRMVFYDGGKFCNTIGKKLAGFKSGILAGGTLIGQRRHWLEIARSFQNISSKMVVFGTGVEDPFFWDNEAPILEWIPILEKCAFIGVRGPISAEVLMRHGLKGVYVCGDPALTFALKNKVYQRSGPDTLGLNIGTSDGRVWGNEIRISNELARLAKMAINAGWSVEWFVVWPRDLRITIRSAQLSKTEHNIHLIFNDYRKFIERAKRLTAFVGMKLHATILATCALTPSIMLEYRPKCKDYMASIGQEVATIRTDSFVAEQVWEMVKYFRDYNHVVTSSLAQGVHALQHKQKMLAEEVRNLLQDFVR